MPLINDRLVDCLEQAVLCDDGGMDEPEAFALIRRAYGVGYVDAFREMPADRADRAVMLDAWQIAARASLALAWSIAHRRDSI